MTPQLNAFTTEVVLAEVRAERERQNAKWGEQNHPDGTGAGSTPLFSSRAFLDDVMTSEQLADLFRFRTEHRFNEACPDRPGTWVDILLEETFEAFAETDGFRLRRELVQVAAVAVQWVEAIDRRRLTADGIAAVGSTAAPTPAITLTHEEATHAAAFLYRWWVESQDQRALTLVERLEAAL